MLKIYVERKKPLALYRPIRGLIPKHWANMQLPLNSFEKAFVSLTAPLKPIIGISFIPFAFGGKLSDTCHFLCRVLFKIIVF